MTDLRIEEVDALPVARALAAARDARVHERLAVGVERGQRVERAERGWGVDVAVLVFEISTNLQWLRLL